MTGAIDRHDRPAVIAVLREAGDAWPQLWRADSPEGLEAWRELAAYLGPCSHLEIGALLGITRQGAQQRIASALKAFTPRAQLAGLDRFEWEHGETAWERLEREAPDELDGMWTLSEQLAKREGPGRWRREMRGLLRRAR